MTVRNTLILTGAHGFVAGSVLAQSRHQWQVHAVSRGEPLAARDGLQWHTCDPQRPAQLAQLFHEARPQAVIHTAAAADIDFCQAHPEAARAANVEFTRTVVDLCGDTGARLVFCSTDTLFDGEHAPYSEDATPGPVNFYAQTKVEAEQLVARLGSQAVIARLSLVVGLPLLGAGNSFLVRMIAALKDGKTVSVSEREVRTPVDVITLGRALLELAARNHHGIFHLAGSSRVSRFEMAQKIALCFGLPQSLVIPQDALNAPDRAPRPRDVSLNNGKASALLETPMRTLDEGLSLIRQTAKMSAL